MKRFLFVCVLFSMLFSFTSYASNMIPPAPAVELTDYKYFAVFYNKYYNGYFLQYSSTPITVDSRVNGFMKDNSIRYFWSAANNDKDWVQDFRSGAFTHSVSYNLYLGGNHTIKNDLGEVVCEQSSTSSFVTHVVSNNAGYTAYWADPYFPSTDDEGGGGIIDLSGIILALKNILNGITSLPERIVSAILSGLQALFVPSDGFFQEKVNFVVEKFKVSFGVSPFDMSSMFSSQKALSDIDINIMGVSGTIVDTSYLLDAIATFRKIIRGFIALLLVFYNINQFLSFIGQAPIAFGALVGLGSRSGGDGKGGED